MPDVPYHTPPTIRTRGRGGIIIEAPTPFIPHGERLAPEDQDVPLPLPLCEECGDPIYYEKREWHHRDPGRRHPAVPHEEQETCANGHPWVAENLRPRGKNGWLRCRLCVQELNRKAREKAR